MTLDEFVASIENEGGTPATEAELSRFEERIGVPLPEALRAFLKRSGGGMIFNTPVEYRDTDGRELQLRHMCDLVEIEREFTKPSAYPLPPALFVIGNDAGGNSIMICLSKERNGQIFVLDHEMVAYEGEAETLEEAEENGLVAFYSPSFNQFLTDLRIAEDQG
ncbi:SMI1/KNR4 family protein [Agrobacterium sp. fls2-241-TYG-188a]|uniref:SMI1/KNR4 family protein n=1 Tax=Agrobacterium sp. fls2-241-TYG-188a TaxID=3040275 RepID=UPI00254FFC5D|nr:SMI1/KNR4 family protein [Agrobacterium sp. fls2-241-TYG-188a]